jgi:dienelactone hydrolase
LGPNSPISAGFTAHPSGVLLSEWQTVTKPISIAFGDLDASNTPANRTSITTIFEQKNATFQTAVFSNAEHGFAVRTDLTIPQKAFAQEGAYWQALRWLDAWAK